MIVIQAYGGSWFEVRPGKNIRPGKNKLGTVNACDSSYTGSIGRRILVHTRQKQDPV
jgi:hypothetical protein